MLVFGRVCLDMRMLEDEPEQDGIEWCMEASFTTATHSSSTLVASLHPLKRNFLFNGSGGPWQSVE